MKYALRLFAAIAALLGSSLACVALMGTPIPAAIETQPPSAAAPAETELLLTEIPAAEELACAAITEQMIEASLVEGGEGETLDEEIYLVTYYVSGNDFYDTYYENVGADLQDEQDDQETHQRVWDFFTTLIPADWRKNIGEYSIITDGADGTLAAVAQTIDDPNLWGLEVDIADVSDIYSLTFTLIHEFGHLLTLGPNQVPPDEAVFNNPDDNDIYMQAVSQCPRYFPGEGCANADSYINAFYDEFWVEIHDEWNEINLEEDEDLYYEKLDEFYYAYEEQFVTSYAATNPEEDMAEAWTFFILAPAPAGESIAEEKILFFYQYPELVELRGQILHNVCLSFSE